MVYMEYFVCPSLVHFSCSFISESRMSTRVTAVGREELTAEGCEELTADDREEL